jgi:hypothetical protein
MKVDELPQMRNAHKILIGKSYGKNFYVNPVVVVVVVVVERK